MLGELLGGFVCGSQTARNRRELDAFIHTPRVRLPVIDAETAEHYAAMDNLISGSQIEDFLP
ncbi:MAG: hypothetical protein IT486_02645 [Gammaproteobacteria bacterium]|nr:hypothetical protein [Gammaproteobacteria bacterium]